MPSWSRMAEPTLKELEASGGLKPECIQTAWICNTPHSTGSILNGSSPCGGWGGPSSLWRIPGMPRHRSPWWLLKRGFRLTFEEQCWPRWILGWGMKRVREWWRGWTHRWLKINRFQSVFAIYNRKFKYIHNTKFVWRRKKLHFMKLHEQYQITWYSLVLTRDVGEGAQEHINIFY